MVQNEIFKSAVFLLDHVHHWILLLINYSEIGEDTPGHRIHDRRSRGRCSDLLKLPNNKTGCGCMRKLYLVKMLEYIGWNQTLNEVRTSPVR